MVRILIRILVRILKEILVGILVRILVSILVRIQVGTLVRTLVSKLHSRLRTIASLTYHSGHGAGGAVCAVAAAPNTGAAGARPRRSPPSAWTTSSPHPVG